MDLKTILRIFSDKKCSKVYIKSLAANDNSKNQVYFGGSFDVLNILPIKEIIADNDGDRKKTTFKTKLDFYWFNDNSGEFHVAPEAQLILYPKYPEVRFSGFLKGSKEAPSELMASRIENRMLFLGVSLDGKVFGYVVHPDSALAKEVVSMDSLEDTGVFKVITIVGGNIELDSKSKLLQELKRIYDLGWIYSKRFDAQKCVLPCNSSNCGGYTLEAELGISPNGYSEPDYLGWEVKQFSVNDFTKIHSKVITLMTPEPTDGFYHIDGVEAFINRYGYEDKRGREARINFGGVHKFGQTQSLTKLKLVLDGYNAEAGKIENTNGYLGLIDANENVAASWSFSSLLKHWNKKHANACYVPSKVKSIEHDTYSKQYSFGNRIMLGSHTDFSLFLKQVALGNIYYDPGIKLELAIPGVREKAIKRRSQFRIKSGNLTTLYKTNEVIDLNQP